MPEFLSLSDAVRSLIQPGASIAPEGFTHLIPFAACHEIIRQRITGLTLMRLTPDLVGDQLVGMGCIDKLIFGWIGNPGIGSLHRIRDAIENGWPQPLELDERSLGAMTVAYAAGAAAMPAGFLKGSVGTSLNDLNQNLQTVACPFTGQKLTAVRALNPDVAVLHAQCADLQGNVFLWGITGVHKEVALGAKKVMVTVEEVVSELKSGSNDCILPSWTVDVICLVPGGAYPSHAQGFYGRDNEFYRSWQTVSQSRAQFSEWMETHIRQPADWTETLELIARQKSLE